MWRRRGRSRRQSRPPPGSQTAEESAMGGALRAMLVGFRSPEQERQYCEARTRDYFFLVDRYSALFRAGVPLLLAFRQIWGREGEGPEVHQRVIVAGAAVFMIVSVALAYVKRSWAVWARDPLSVFLRVTVIPITVITSFKDSMKISNPPNWANFFLCSWLCTGFSVASAFPFAMPLHFKHHVWVTAAFVWLMSTFQVPQFCQMVGHRSDMHHYVISSWRALSGRAWKVLNTMYMLDIEERASPEIYGVCGHLYTFLLLYFGLVLPTYIVWTLEYQSRAFFLSRAVQHDSSSKARRNQREAQWLPLTWPVIFLHSGLLVVLYAVSWEVTLGWFVGMEDRKLLACGELVKN